MRWALRRLRLSELIIFDLTSGVMKRIR
jgi:hypothetical protein